MLHQESRDLDSQYEVRLTRECRLVAQPLGRHQAALGSDIYLYADQPYLLRLVGKVTQRLHLRIINASTHSLPSGVVFERVLIRREDLLSSAHGREPEPAYRLVVPSLAATELLAATHRPDAPRDAPSFEVATDEEALLCHGKGVPRLRVHVMLHDMRALANEAEAHATGASHGDSVLRAVFEKGKLRGEPQALCHYHRQADGECLLLAEKETGGTSVAIRVLDKREGTREINCRPTVYYFLSADTKFPAHRNILSARQLITSRSIDERAHLSAARRECPRLWHGHA